MRYFVLRQKRTNAGITWFLDVLYRNKTNCAGVIILVIAIVALCLFLSTVCFMVHSVDMTLKYHIWPYSFILDIHFKDILKISAKWFEQWNSMNLFQSIQISVILENLKVCLTSLNLSWVALLTRFVLPTFASPTRTTLQFPTGQ